MLNRVKRTTTAGIAAHQILEQIRSGELRPGHKLPPEHELMKQLGVGRSTVREAKQLLSARNLLSYLPGRGTFIREIDLDTVVDLESLQLLLARQTLADLQEVRRLLEPECVALATKRVTPKTIAELDRLVQILGHSDTREDETRRAGLEFHRVLVAATRNQVLIKLYDVVVKLLVNHHRPVYPVDRALEHQLHLEILEAVMSRDPEQARKAMRDHLEVVGDRVLLDHTSRERGESPD